jgi:hypothetical protein
MKSREELLRDFAGNAHGLAEYAVALQGQIAQAKEELAQTTQQVAEAQALIADLPQELFGFGAKAEK